MKCAKEFAEWLNDRVGHHDEGVYLTRRDLLELTHRQRFNSCYATDIHYEVMQYGMGFVSDAHRERFYFFRLPETHWKSIAITRFDDTLNQNQALHAVEK